MGERCRSETAERQCGGETDQSRERFWCFEMSAKKGKRRWRRNVWRRLWSPPMMRSYRKHWTARFKHGTVGRNAYSGTRQRKPLANRLPFLSRLSEWTKKHLLW